MFSGVFCVVFSHAEPLLAHQHIYIPHTHCPLHPVWLCHVTLLHQNHSTTHSHPWSSAHVHPHLSCLLLQQVYYTVHRHDASGALALTSYMCPLLCWWLITHSIESVQNTSVPTPMWLYEPSNMNPQEHCCDCTSKCWSPICHAIYHHLLH